MGKYIVKVRRILKNKGSVTPKKCLGQLISIVDEYRESVKGEVPQSSSGSTLIDPALDPSFATKQDQAVNSPSDEDEE
jgi:hypothetical protein